MKIRMTKPEVRAAVVRAAASQVGYTEGRNNWTKYAVETALKWMQNQPWCGLFYCRSVWVATGKQVALWKHANWMYTPTIVSEAKKHGAWKTNRPLPGDASMQNFPGGSFVDHIEVVVSGNKTIGGNTSSGTRGSQSNGGGVFRRTRNTPQVIGWVDLEKILKAYGYEFEGAQAPAKPAPKPTTGAKVLTGVVAAAQKLQGTVKGEPRGPFPLRGNQWFGPGGVTSGQAGVAMIQRKVGVTPDGAYGPKTTAAVKAWQKRVGLPASEQDGLVGPLTWGLM